jgi:hypothetical protein
MARSPGRGQVAQLVEHTTENRGVGGSIPPLTTSPEFGLTAPSRKPNSAFVRSRFTGTV